MCFPGKMISFNNLVLVNLKHIETTCFGIHVPQRETSFISFILFFITRALCKNVGLCNRKKIAPKRNIFFPTTEVYYLWFRIFWQYLPSLKLFPFTLIDVNMDFFIRVNKCDMDKWTDMDIQSILQLLFRVSKFINQRRFSF